MGADGAAGWAPMVRRAARACRFFFFFFFFFFCFFGNEKETRNEGKREKEKKNGARWVGLREKKSQDAFPNPRPFDVCVCVCCVFSFYDNLGQGGRVPPPHKSLENFFSRRKNQKKKPRSPNTSFFSWQCFCGTG
jgi:hypothetical protein